MSGVFAAVYTCCSEANLGPDHTLTRSTESRANSHVILSQTEAFGDGSCE